MMNLCNLRHVAGPARPYFAVTPDGFLLLTAAQTAEKALREQMGVGFALGRVDKGPAFAGVDLDQCRNPATGIIEEWAWKIIRHCDSYTEISPSGTGVKIFLLGWLPDGTRQGKV